VTTRQCRTRNGKALFGFNEHDGVLHLLQRISSRAYPQSSSDTRPAPPLRTPAGRYRALSFFRAQSEALGTDFSRQKLCFVNGGLRSRAPERLAPQPVIRAATAFAFSRPSGLALK
jgi:hypothetical protein